MKTISDFPDWLGPMLVKELRQGLKARGFVLSFLIFQAILIVVLIYNVLDYRNSGVSFSPAPLSSIFWMLIGAQLIVITPLRALNELAAERKANTLELIFMSGLSAWRITFGKWISLLFQALLFVLAILPYAILRYYFGGVNLTEDLGMMGGTLISCALISAVALAISGLPLFARIAAMVLGLFFGMGLLQSMIFFVRFAGSGMGSAFGGMAEMPWLLIVLDSAIACLFALEIGAATIAPIAENHAGRQRALALLAWLPVPIMMVLKADEASVGAQAVFFTILAAVLSWYHLAGVPFPLQSYCRPFAGARALLGVPFQPGWPSALIFLTLSLGLLAVPVFIVFPKDGSRWFFAVCVAAGGALLTSTLFWVVFRRRSRHPLVEQTIFIGLCAAAVLLIVAGLPHGSHIGEFLPMACIPPMAVFSMLESSAEKWQPWLAAGGCAFGAYALILLLLSRKYWSYYFRRCQRLGSRPAAPAIP